MLNSFILQFIKNLKHKMAIYTLCSIFDIQFLDPRMTVFY